LEVYSDEIRLFYEKSSHIFRISCALREERKLTI